MKKIKLITLLLSFLAAFVVASSQVNAQSSSEKIICETGAYGEQVCYSVADSGEKQIIEVHEPVDTALDAPGQLIVFTGIAVMAVLVVLSGKVFGKK